MIAWRNILTAFLIAVFLPFSSVQAGAFDDMEEAFIRGDSSTAIELVQKGFDINSVNKQGDTLLIQALKSDMPEFFDFLLSQKARLNTRNANGETALSLAAFTGRLAYVEKLVQKGADVNMYGWSPLVYAAFNGHADVAEYLLKHGANVNAKTQSGATALFFAARNGHEKVVENLLAAGGNPRIADENELTAVDWALKSENTDIAQLLRSYGGKTRDEMLLELKPN